MHLLSLKDNFLDIIFGCAEVELGLHGKALILRFNRADEHQRSPESAGGLHLLASKVH